VTVEQALQYKDRFAQVEGVRSADWIDDVVGRETLTATPLEFLDSSVLDGYYKDGCALVFVEIERGMEKSAVARLRELIGKDDAIAGDAVNTAAAMEMSAAE
jgi:hypothetical protein